jgi:hypothetical protein
MKVERKADNYLKLREKPDIYRFIENAMRLIRLPPPPLQRNKDKSQKNRRKHNGFRPSLLAAILVWIWLFRLTFFQLLKFVMPGASFAEDFGIGFYFRANVGGAGIKHDAVAF